MGLVIEPWRDLGWFLDKARFLGRMDAAWAFLCGDLLAEGETRFGEEWSQLSAAFGLEPVTLMARQTVARMFPPEVRDPRLSWSHYHAAAAMRRRDPETALGLLEWCKRPGADYARPRTELRRAINGVESERLVLHERDGRVVLVDTWGADGPVEVEHLDEFHLQHDPRPPPPPQARPAVEILPPLDETSWKPAPPPVVISDTVTGERGTALALVAAGPARPAGGAVPQDAIDEWADWGLRLARSVCGSPDAGLALDPASLDRLAELLATLDPRRRRPDSRDAGTYWARPGHGDEGEVREK